MRQVKADRTKRIGFSGHINKNCWLAKELNYSPAKRCQYCDLDFHHCPLFQYLIISLILIFFALTVCFFAEGKILNSVLISILALVFVYGYFFNKNTERLVEISFKEKKAIEALEKEKKSLEIKVKARTKELKEFTESLDKQVKERTKELQQKLEELEKMNKLMTDREMRMIELKKEIKKLKKVSKT